MERLFIKQDLLYGHIWPKLVMQTWPLSWIFDKIGQNMVIFEDFFKKKTQQIGMINWHSPHNIDELELNTLKDWCFITEISKI